jgi:hypothetical protein
MSFQKFIVASDIHGDLQNREANEVLFKFVNLWKPHIRICGGDLWDFRPLRKKASEDERRESLVKDFNAGMTWLDRFKPHYFLRGNHDERLWDLAQNGTGVAADFAHQGIMEIERKMSVLRCNMLPYDKRKGIVRIGSLKVIHGFFSGVNAARRTALTYGSVLMGHGHGISHTSIEGLDNRIGRMIGCLCELDMPYNRHLIGSLLHRHGFAYGIIGPHGTYHVWQAEKVGSTWYLPTDFVQL